MNVLLKTFINSVMFLALVLGLPVAALAVIALMFLYLKWMIVRYVRLYSCEPTDEQPARPKHLKALQYNVFWRPEFSHIGREEYLRERMEQTVDRIVEDGYDLVGIEEAWQLGSDLVDDFVKLLRERGYKYIVSGELPGLFTRLCLDSGLLLISKYPIVAYDAMTYVDSYKIDYIYGKGALYGRVNVGNNAHVHVFVTHLQATYTLLASPEDKAIRKKQLAQLRKFIEKNAIDGAPIMVFGDFNVDWLHSEEKELFDHELTLVGYDRIDTLPERPVTYADTEDGKPLETVLTVEKDLGGMMSLDYVFWFKHKDGDQVIENCKGRLEKFLVEGKPYRQLSDHYGIAVDIDMRN